MRIAAPADSNPGRTHFLPGCLGTPDHLFDRVEKLGRIGGRLAAYSAAAMLKDWARDLVVIYTIIDPAAGMTPVAPTEDRTI